MWQHKELHDGFKRAGLKEADFYAGNVGGKKGENGAMHSATLARPISSQGRERPQQRATDPNETYNSEAAYGTVREDYGQVRNVLLGFEASKEKKR